MRIFNLNSVEWGRRETTSGLAEQARKRWPERGWKADRRQSVRARAGRPALAVSRASRKTRSGLSWCVLMLSTNLMPEIVEYLDTGKVGVRSAVGEYVMLARPGPTMEYWEGED
jgi:hypothetical protein